MKNALIPLLSVALASAAVLGSGCTWVKPVAISNTPGDAPATTSGAPKETLDYFEQIYPPKGWPPTNVRYRAAVCPLLVSRDAVLLLAGDSAQQVLLRAEAGNAKVAALFQTPGSPTQFVVTETLSDKAQAILLEELLARGPFEVFAASRSGFGSDGFLKELSDKGIPLCVIGSLDSDPKQAGEVRAYVRVIETDTGVVRCAVSDQGGNLDEAVRRAAAKLVASFDRK
jgi:hypothetical protein